MDGTQAGDSGRIVYTIGHSNSPSAAIVDLLQRRAITLLVDVRSSPYSQYASQFNRELFRRVLSEAGIAYSYAGEALGGRPTDPSCYKTGQVPLGKANYLKLVDYEAVQTREWYRRAIARLLELAGQQTTAIMCSEEDPLHCHRHHLIAQTLLQQGIEVRHLRGDGTCELAAGETRHDAGTQLSLFGPEGL